MTTMDGMNQERQQKINRSLVISLLRQEGICSRATLANLSGLKRATLTNMMNEFIECGLVVEDGLLDGDKGRRSIGVRINGQRYRVIGVMVTRQSFSLSLMGISGEVYGTRFFPIVENRTADQIIERIKQEIHALIHSEPECHVLAIGVALPGPYKREDGEMVFVTNLPGWERIPVCDRLQDGFDIPVFIENDANTGAFAQLWRQGKSEDCYDLIYIVAGQGIGCGIISGGEILRGSIGIAGEIGHTTINFDGPQCECGNTGCLEMYCSTIVLERNIQKCMDAGEVTDLPSNFTLNDISEAIGAGNHVVSDEYGKACRYLAIGIVNLINQLNPRRVILGDELVKIDSERMLAIVNEEVRARVRPMIWASVTIETNQLVHNPVLIGAGVIAAQHVFEDPFSFVRFI